jgi:hypothetical protein
VAASIAAGAFGVSGCGASSALDPVAQAASASTSKPGYRMTLSLQLSSSSLPSAITGTGTGSFDLTDHVGSITMDMNLGSSPQVVQALGGSTFHTEEVLQGLTVYMKLPAALASRLPGAKPWLKLDLQKAASAAGIPGLSSLTSSPAGSDPSQFLQYLRAASGAVTSVGAETVDGVPTTHYRAQIALDRVAGMLSSDSRAAAKQAIAAMEKTTGLHDLPVDVWIDAAHLVRRIAMTFDENVQAGQSIHMKMSMDFTDYAPQPRPAAPSSDQVTDLTALLGGLGAGG